MRDIPIIFSAPMVRALLDGRKTMTRRVLKLPTKSASGGPICEHPKMGGWEPTTIGGGGCFTIGKNGERVPAPEQVAIWHRTCGTCVASPYQRSDRLYVREAWRTSPEHDLRKPKDVPIGAPLLTIADTGLAFPSPLWGKYRHARFMPRCFSRLTLIVSAVKIERLQEVSEEDAIAEGVTKHPNPVLGFHVPGIEHPNKDFPVLSRPTAREMFAALWDTVHDSGAWLANPFVVAISFDVVKQNIDALPLAEAA